MKRGMGILILLAVLLVCTCADAYLIQIGVEGTVTSVWDAGAFDGKIHTGDAITGYYTYESTTLDSDPDPTGGLYWHYTSPYGINLSIGGFTFQTDPNNVEFSIGVINGPGWDAYSVSNTYYSPLSNGVTVNELFWQLEDPTSTAIDSDALLLTPPIPSNWGGGSSGLYINCGPRIRDSVITGEITYTYLIPEPASVSLILAGLVLIRRKTAFISIH